MFCIKIPFVWRWGGCYVFQDLEHRILILQFCESLLWWNIWFRTGLSPKYQPFLCLFYFMIDRKLCLGIEIHFLGININGLCVPRNPTLQLQSIKTGHRTLCFMDWEIMMSFENWTLVSSWTYLLARLPLTSLNLRLMSTLSPVCWRTVSGLALSLVSRMTSW